MLPKTFLNLLSKMIEKTIRTKLAMMVLKSFLKSFLMSLVTSFPTSALIRLSEPFVLLVLFVFDSSSAY